jgi:hypothetical protein
MTGAKRTARYRENKRKAKGLERKSRGRNPTLTDSEVKVLLDRVEKDIEKGNFHSLMWVRVGLFDFLFISFSK